MKHPLNSWLAFAAAAAVCAAWPLPALAQSPAAGAGKSSAAAQKVRELANPTDKAQRNITGFSSALRCMDEMLFRNGVRDLTLMMEDFRDTGQRLPVSTRDMMVSAFSEMTRRSRAIRLSVFGGDQQNMLNMLQQAQRNNAFAVLPEYGIRGSISQIDEDVKRDSASLGIVGNLLGLRLGGDTRYSVMGFDAAVVRMDSMTLVPGATSKNSTVISRRDTGSGEGQAKLLGGSAVFAFSTSRSDGLAQVARNMIELAAIELVGKLTRQPYWQCLGTADTDREVMREMEDWFEAMDEDERIIFVKERMRERRYFEGVLDARADEEFQAALAGYRRALGVAGEGRIDFDFFKLLITKSVPRGSVLVARQRPSAVQTAGAAGTAVAGAASAAVAPASAPGDAGPAVAVASALPAGPATRLRSIRAPEPLSIESSTRPEGLQLTVGTSQDGYLVCYARDAGDGALRRIYPNRFARDGRVAAGALVKIPGQGRFALTASVEVACLLTPRDVLPELPAALRAGDFEDIRQTGFEQLRARFAEAAAGPVPLVMAPRVRP